MTAGVTRRQAFVFILYAARMKKNLPLLLAIGLSACLLLIPAGATQMPIAMAMLPAIAMRGVVEVVLALPRATRRDDALRSTLPDAVFFGSRAFTAVALLATMA